MFRVVVVTAICGGLIYLLGNTVLTGLRTGRIAHTNSSSFCQRSKNPLGYWALVILFSGIAIGCIFAWVQVLRDAFA